MKKASMTALVGLLVLFPAVFGLAAEDDGYLGMSLPGDYRIFSADSWWNQPIPANSKVDPMSRAMMRQMDRILKSTDMPDRLVVAVDKWTPPMHLVDVTKAPLKTVYNTGHCLHSSIDPGQKNLVEGIPMPDQLWADPSNDGSMIVIDIKNRVVWDFWRAFHRADGQWEAGAFFRWELDGLGYPTELFTDECFWGVGIRGSGVSILGGLVRPEELQMGVINHAIALASPNNRRVIAEGVPWIIEFCHPIASESDAAAGGDTGGVGPQYIPEGARIQLNPDLDLDSLGLSRNAKIIARALQVYGGFLLDNSGAFHMYVQNLGPGDHEVYEGVNDLGNIPLHEFRVLACDLAKCLDKRNSCVITPMDQMF